MKKIKYIFLSMMVALSLVSCQKEPVESANPSEVPEGYVKVILDMERDFGTQEVSTRSGERTGDPMIATSREMAISNAFVCVFAYTNTPANDLLLQYEPVIRDFDALGKPHYYAVLKEVDSPVIIHGLSNIDNTTVNKITAKVDQQYTLTRSEFYQLEIPYSNDPSSVLLKNQEGALLPKFTEAIVLDKLTPEEIQSTTATTRFSYTRVDVVMPTIAGSEYPKILGLSATNVPNLPAERATQTLRSHEVTPSSNLPAYGETASDRQWPTGVSATNNQTKYAQGLYMYYNNRKKADGTPQEIITEDKAIELIIRAQRDENSPAEGSYYKILLRYKNEGATEYSYDTYTANRYLVNVHVLNSAGYATWEEANDAPPSNVLYDINIDGISTSYITNGQYYIGVEQANYQALVNYSDQSNMMYKNPTIVTEGNIKNIQIFEDGTCEFDFIFSYNAGDESITNSSLTTKTLELPAGISIMSATTGYHDSQTWDDDFGTKKLRLNSSSKNIDGEIVIKVGELTHSSKIEISTGIITDYTNYKFVNELTGLPDGYGGKASNNLLLSNSYILKAHDTHKAVFFIPVTDRVNDFWKNYSGLSLVNTIPTENWINNTDFEIKTIWYDGTSIDGLSLERWYSPSGQNAIKVELPKNFIEQNILIALSKGDEIIWSWHLWVTDYNPYLVNLKEDASSSADHPVRTELNQIQQMAGDGNALHSYTGAIWQTGIYADKFIMDRDLGALSPDFIGHGSCDGTPPYTAGALQFQFGRKDPIPHYATYVDGSTQTPSVSGLQTFAYAVNNPDKFIMNAPNWANEAVDVQSEACIWNDKNIESSTYETGKSIFDPSPLGFRLPINGTWDGFSISNFIRETGLYGGTYADFAYYPSTGYRNNRTTEITRAGASTYSRSVNAINNDNTYVFTSRDGGVFPNDPATRAGSEAVRPIQE